MFFPLNDVLAGKAISYSERPFPHAGRSSSPSKIPFMFHLFFSFPFPLFDMVSLLVHASFDLTEFPRTFHALFCT